MSYAVVLDMKDKWILVVGAGPVGLRKATAALEEGASVRMVTLDVSHEVESLKREYRSSLEIKAEPYHSAHLDQMDLVVAATSDLQVNEQIHRDCRDRHLWCNNASDASGSDFANLAGLTRGSLAFFASSQSGAPGLMREVLIMLVDGLREDVLEKIEHFGPQRRKIRQEVKDPQERRALLLQLKRSTMQAVKAIKTNTTGGQDHEHQGR
jgi:siroheme synthase-like protein